VAKTQQTKLTSGQLARRVGVNTETIRRYEKRGIITSERIGPLGIRLYPPEAVDVVLRKLRASTTAAHQRVRREGDARVGIKPAK
jgi:hypothetical protein